MYETDNPKYNDNGCCDSEELVNKVEAVFGIELKPDECERIITVGDLQAAIIEKLGPNLGEGCVSHAAFHRVRRVLIDYYGATRKEVRLERELLELAPSLGPPKTRRREWKTFSDCLECHLPDLELSRIDSAILFLVALTCLIPAFLNYRLIPVLLVLMCVLLWGMRKLLNWLAPSAFNVLPKECSTVDGLVRTMARRNYGAIARRREFRNESEIWEILSEIIVEVSGVKPEEVKKEARFQADLEFD